MGCPRARGSRRLSLSGLRCQRFGTRRRDSAGFIAPTAAPEGLPFHQQTATRTFAGIKPTRFRLAAIKPTRPAPTPTSPSVEGSGTATMTPGSGSFRGLKYQKKSWPLKPRASNNNPKSFEYRESALAQSA
jgi:hypothetical protein